MLQRAATNAYSWWWASHIRTKQSKWLEHNLQDMEEKVRHMLKLIDEDGDSFAKRAEMYYRKRPELISFVEEAFRAYRALAERYDHISGELHKANHTIATVFPEKVQFAMDEEEEEEEEEEGGALKESSSNHFNPSQDPTRMPEVPKGTLPKILRSFKKDAEGSPRKPIKKMQPKNTITSQISKDEALEEIDKLQKGILALQTEKEFIKSSCENGLAKYWEIEKEITEMQEKVSSLQDEFNVGTVIEDNEARSLMAYKALKSCQDTLVQLQKKQEKSAEEAAVECQRINDAHRKLDALKLEHFQEKRDQQNLPQRQFLDSSSTQEDLNQEASGDLKQEKVESESIRSKIREYFELSSGSSINVMEMAEKIDELVTKVISLETAVSSQTALIKRLRSETDELHAHLKSLEDERAAIMKDSNDSNGKIRELEDKLQAAWDLNKNFEDQSNNLQTHFTEAHCNLNLLSEQLKCVKKLDEDSKITYSSVAEGSIAVESHEKHEEQETITTSVYPGKEEERITEAKKTITGISVNDLEEGLEAPAIGDSLSGKVQESDQQNGIGKSRFSRTVDANLNPEQQQQSTNLEDTPNWQQLLINGLNDKEKILLEEYTVILRKYKEAKKELHEVEKQSRESVFEVLMQLRDVKNSNTMKDEEIQSLRQKLEIVQTSGDNTGLTKQDESKQGVFQERMAEGLTSQPCSSATVNLDKQSSNMVHGENKDAGMQNNVANTEWKEKKKIIVDEPHDFPTIEEKFRRDIDELLEENLKFWLRFSTSFNQIQKFKTETQDLRAEFLRVKENQKKHDGNTTTLHESIKSDVRPIYQHMREIQTELGVWLEQNMLLKDELKYRLSSLCVMQEEISRVSKTSTRSENPEFSGYQAAKFLGEVLNMQQENNKVADELQAGLDLVNGFQLEIEKTLTTMDEDFKFSTPKNHNANVKYSLSRTRIPLRSFLFGVKAKKHKPSLFSCMSPALQKQYSDLQCDLTL